MEVTDPRRDHVGNQVPAKIGTNNPDNVTDLIDTWAQAGIPCVLDDNQMAWPIFDLTVSLSVPNVSLTVNPDWNHPLADFTVNVDDI